jgi:PPE-repeat protein
MCDDLRKRKGAFVIDQGFVTISQRRVWRTGRAADPLQAQPMVGGASANIAQGTVVGRLTVPPTWTATAQVANHSGVTFAGGGWTDAVGPAGGGESAPVGMPGMPGAPMAGQGRAFGHGPRYGFHVTVMPRPPAAG